MKFIVDFHNHTDQSLIDNYLTTNGCTVLKEWENFDKVYLVEAATEPPTTDITAFVRNDEALAIKPVIIADINNYYGKAVNPTLPTGTISTSDEKDWWKNFSMQTPVFDAPTAEFSKKGKNIHVYIMDSGIEASHPEFTGVDISNVYTITPGDFSDKNGHGTAIASVISGNTCGISSAKIKVVKIFEPDYDTMQSQLLDALDAILDDVPDRHFALVNCSWIIEKNEWVEYKMREMTQRGIWIIAAAGNQGKSIEDVTPASMPEVFTVGAYNQDLLPCDFSNYTGDHLNPTQGEVNSGELDGWAPGIQIYVAALNGTYNFVGGTSIAAAIMTACAANNLNDDVYSDGTRSEWMDGIAPVGPDAATGRLASRTDILDLSDPKYQFSNNRIATFAREMPPWPCTDEFTVTAKVGVDNSLAKLFEPSMTKSFAFTSPVPANFYIQTSGMFFGRPTEDEGPDINESFKLYNLTAKRVDLNDVEEDITVTMYVIRQNYQPSELPEDHPLNIALQVGLCSDYAGAQGLPQCSLYTNPPCFNNCNWSCCATTTKSPVCVCIG